MDATAMTFQDNSFDYVFCLEVLEHLNERSSLDAVQEMKRVSRGKVVISVPFEELTYLNTIFKGLMKKKLEIYFALLRAAVAN